MKYFFLIINGATNNVGFTTTHFRTVVWAILSAWYPGLPYLGSGLLNAEQPWSGYYEIPQYIWLAGKANFLKYSTCNTEFISVAFL